MIPETVARCACGAAYTEKEWLRLRLLGVQEDVFGAPPSELRNCRCGSTISRPVPTVDARRCGWLRGLLGGGRR
jgi:hypothetical protein